MTIPVELSQFWNWIISYYKCPPIIKPVSKVSVFMQKVIKDQLFLLDLLWFIRQNMLFLWNNLRVNLNTLMVYMRVSQYETYWYMKWMFCWFLLFTCKHWITVILMNRWSTYVLICDINLWFVLLVFFYFIQGAHYKEALKILKLVVTRSSTLVAPPTSLHTPHWETSATSPHPSFTDSEIFTKKELPGMWSSFLMINGLCHFLPMLLVLWIN